MNVPVTLILFNRPDLTLQVFRRIREARPRQLFLIADGPRPEHPEDERLCAAARGMVDQVDWDCDVRRDFAESNIGCGVRPASGITWVLEQVDRTIILEDDALPHPSFFPWCEEMLERYAADERVMQVCGPSPWAAEWDSPYSYWFSRTLECTGWATWARAWRHHDMRIVTWPELRGTDWLRDLSTDPRFLANWSRLFDTAYLARNDVDYWDYQWVFAIWSRSALTVMPRANLITNLGYRLDGTHTTSPRNKYANLPAGSLGFPLRHPPRVLRESGYDRIAIPRHYERPRPSLTERVRRRVGRFVPEPIKARLR